MELDKEIIEGFQEEANTILKELRDVIDALEEVTDTFPQNLLKEFANKIDRIMGTTKTFDEMYPGNPVFTQISKFGELCKATGYKAATLNHLGLIPIFAAFWADTLDIMEDLCEHVGEPDKLKKVTQSYIPTLQKRLVWLAQQIVTITKGASQTTKSEFDVDGILRRLGIDV